MTNLIQKFEKLLDHDDHFENFNFQKNAAFQIEPEHKHLENISFEPGPKQWEIFFTRLTAFFEIGFLIQNSEIKKMFFYGDMIERKLPRMSFSLPKSPLFNILKTPGKPFLDKMGLKLSQSKKMNCLLVRLDENTYIVLLSGQANPWLQLRCESLRKALTNHDYYSP